MVLDRFSSLGLFGAAFTPKRKTARGRHVISEAVAIKVKTNPLTK